MLDCSDGTRYNPIKHNFPSRSRSGKASLTGDAGFPRRGRARRLTTAAGFPPLRCGGEALVLAGAKNEYVGVNPCLFIGTGFVFKSERGTVSRALS
ncbi:hypothetical protein [Neomoorella mulderi]|uniref:hypothetical protein n=1 Tax=Neomoorella mulderi TaxID=202604 RepID=UPI001372809C|nr:hypothetical protein [Moorella mulderi]